MKLREIAHARSGDKGNISNISLIAWRAEDYDKLLSVASVEKVKAWLSDTVSGEVLRYELPELAAVNFVMYDALGGGVTRSLALDIHGKGLSFALLDMPVD